MNNKLLTTMLAILLAITLVGAGALYVLLKAEKKGEAEAATIEEVLEASVEVPEITTNLLSGDFIRISFMVQTDNKDTKKELEKRMFQVNNLIIKELSNMTTEDFEGSKGKTDLEESLKSDINDLLTDGEIVQVYITSYILQQ